MKSKSVDKKTFLVYLILLYVGIVLTRFLLALATSSFPTVGIDEYLYYSLGRSIATEGKLLFRGQSADYAYLLYPLTLSPVYLLFQEGANFYRLLQLWNILLMSASVFPLFFLSKELLGSEKKAFLPAALSMLLPDFILGELIFSEAIIYPLFFTLMYCAYRYIEKDKKSCILWVGFLGGLLYSTKPGAVVPAAVFLVMTVVLAIVKKKGKDALLAFCSALIMVATAGAFWILAEFAFGYEGSIFSIYEAQLDGSIIKNKGMFFKSLVLYLYYFILACGMIGFIYPFTLWKKWKPEKKLYWWFMIVALAVMIIGSAWAVEQVTSLNNVHLRYTAMYIPLFLLFCFIPIEPEKKTKKGFVQSKKSIAFWIVLGFVVVCTVALGVKSKAQTTIAHPMITLSVLNDSILPVSKQLIGNIVVVCLSIVFAVLFITGSGKDHLRKTCIAGLTVFMVINGILGYKLFREASYYPKLARDGREVHALTQGDNYVFLLYEEGIADIGVDVNTKSNNDIVYTSDFINCLQENNGVYVPYTPASMRGIKSAKETKDVETLVVDYDSYSYMKFSKHSTAESPFERKTVFVVRFTLGDRIVDSTLSNLTQKTLVPDKPGIILLYDETQYGHPITIKLEIESKITQTMTINSTREIYSVDLSPGKAWYEVTFSRAEDAFNFKVTDASIRVYGYEILNDGTAK